MSNNNNSSGSYLNPGRSTSLLCEECHSRVQAVAELLLIPCKPLPVFVSSPQDLALTQANFEAFRDRVVGQLNKMLLLSREVATQVHSRQIQWKPLCQRIKELTVIVVSLLELSAHLSYLMAVRAGDGQGGKLAVLGPVESVHCLTQADLDIRFSCQRLKRSHVGDLQPNVLVELCTSLTKSLSSMTEVCRHAADAIQDACDQDQFKLCVKAITSTVSCLVTSVKSFRKSPSEALLRRVMTFCDPVTSASSALLAFAAEECFQGNPATLTQPAVEMYKANMGMTVSISSATIQMYRAVRDLVHTSSSAKRHQDRLSLCVESLTRSSGQLREVLLSHSFVPIPVDPNSTPHHSTPQANSPSSSAGVLETERDANISVGSIPSFSGERDDVRKSQSYPYQEERDSQSSEGRPKHGRSLSSSHGSPKSSSREGHVRQSSHPSPSSSAVKTPKSSRKDKDKTKDGSRSPRTKEKKHKNSSVSSSSSSSSGAMPFSLSDHHSQNSPSHSDSSSCADNSDKNLHHHHHHHHHRHHPASDYANVDNQKFNQVQGDKQENSSPQSEVIPSSVDNNRALLPSPTSRPSSMDVDLVLASLVAATPEMHHGTGAGGQGSDDTLPGLRELHLGDGGIGEDVHDVVSDDNFNCRL